MTIAERGGELASVGQFFVTEVVVLAEHSTHEGALSLDASSSVAKFPIRCMRLLLVLQRALLVPVRRKICASLFSVDCGVSGECEGGSSLRRNMRVHIECRWQRSRGRAKTLKTLKMLKTRLSSPRRAFEICRLNDRPSSSNLVLFPLA